MSLQAQLRSSLQKGKNPFQYVRAIGHLGVGVPKESQYWPHLTKLRDQLGWDLQVLFLEQQNPRLMEELAKNEEKQRQFLHEFINESEVNLKGKLKHKQPLQRWLAVQVGAGKRYPFEKEFIDLLADPVLPVRKAARDALIRLSRGNDFGPADNAAGREIQSAQRQWRQWLALQDPRSETLASSDR